MTVGLRTVGIRARGGVQLGLTPKVMCDQSHQVCEQVCLRFHVAILGNRNQVRDSPSHAQLQGALENLLFRLQENDFSLQLNCVQCNLRNSMRTSDGTIDNLD